MSYHAGREKFAVIAEGHTPANTSGVVDLAPDFKVPAHTLKATAIAISPVTGVPGKIVYTFAGTYAVGDTVRLTITSNLTSGQLWNKSYVHTVLSGATTVTDIAAAFASQMSRDVANANAPLASAVNAAGVLTVTQKGDDSRGLTTVKYTNSTAGTVTPVITQTVISEGQPSDLIDNGIPAEKINLATYDTVLINYYPDAATPFIDSANSKAITMVWYGTVGEGATLAALINAL